MRPWVAFFCEVPPLIPHAIFWKVGRVSFFFGIEEGHARVHRPRQSLVLTRQRRVIPSFGLVGFLFPPSNIVLFLLPCFSFAAGALRRGMARCHTVAGGGVGSSSKPLIGLESPPFFLQFLSARLSFASGSLWLLLVIDPWVFIHQGTRLSVSCRPSFFRSISSFSSPSPDQRFSSASFFEQGLVFASASAGEEHSEFAVLL